MTTKRNIRIKDIAEKAGVSIGTVDRVLHKRGEVAETTRKVIMQIVEELDYHPNILASTLASKKNIMIATLMPKSATPDSYWAKPHRGITSAIGKMTQYGVRAQHFYFEMEVEGSFSAEALKLLEANPDAVLMAPWAEVEALKFTQRLDERLIPYLFIDSNLEGAHPVSFVVQNSLQSGYLAAKLIDYGVSTDSQLLLLHITKKGLISRHLSDREKGFMHYFEMRGVSPSRILKLEIAGNSGELEEKLSAVGLALCDIAAVFVTNSKVHLAAESFNSLCKTPKIIGYDLIPQNIALLKTGVIDFLISQKPEAQGYMAANLLFDFLIKKEQVPAENYISIDIIAAENLDYYSSF